MAPKKKKGTKKGDDDWEAELGETIAAAASDSTSPVEDDTGAEAPEPVVGGLMGLMRKNKEKRKKKGLPDLDEAEPASNLDQTGADGPAEDGNGGPDVIVATEAAADETAPSPPPQKGGKAAQKGKAKAVADNDNIGDSADGSGRLMTKAEKEKLKKEREKQRKKEQVFILCLPPCPCVLAERSIY